MADRITFVGHSTVLIELGGVRLLTDPVLRDRVLHIRRHAPTPAAEFSREIDAVLVSHTHADHFDPPSVRRVRAPRLIVPAGTGAIMARRRFRDPTELAPGDAVDLGAVRVRGVNAAHDGRRWPFGRRIRAVGYVIEGNGRTIYFAGDTAPFDAIGEVAADVDVALLPIAGWNANLHTRHHLGPDTAADTAAALRPRIVVPIHWGTLLAAGLAGRREELFERPLREFAGHLRRVAPDVELRTLRPGESTVLGAAEARA